MTKACTGDSTLCFPDLAMLALMQLPKAEREVKETGRDVKKHHTLEASLFRTKSKRRFVRTFRLLKLGVFGQCLSSYPVEMET
eukprot:4470357-Amphidinium_carterae.2